jgi:hypothetical protein
MFKSINDAVSRSGTSIHDNAPVTLSIDNPEGTSLFRNKKMLSPFWSVAVTNVENKLVGLVLLHDNFRLPLSIKLSPCP